MNLNLLPKLSLQPEPSNFRQGSSHAMTSGEDGSSGMLLKQLLHSLINLVFNKMIILKKALVNPTIFTVIFYFLEVEILNPISCVC